MISSLDTLHLLASVLALLVAVLTFYNAARFKTGILAQSTYLASLGMLLIGLSFFVLVLPVSLSELLQVNGIDAWVVANICFMIGFLMLGLSSYLIFRMSRIK